MVSTIRKDVRKERKTAIDVGSDHTIMTAIMKRQLQFFSHQTRLFSAALPLQGAITYRVLIPRSSQRHRQPLFLFAIVPYFAASAIAIRAPEVNISDAFDWVKIRINSACQLGSIHQRRRHWGWEVREEGEGGRMPRRGA